MSDALPKTLRNLAEDARKGGDGVLVFRSYVKLMNAGYKSLEKSRDSVRLADRHVKRISIDHDFFKRHQAKVDVLFRALREVYRNPAKALRTIDELTRAYPAQYVFEVCQLGSYRIGNPVGWNLFGFRSLTRIDADQMYADQVIPALAAMLSDHADYLALRKSDIETQYEEAAADLAQKRSVLAAIEGSIPKWSEEMKACAIALKPKEVEALKPRERDVRLRLLPQSNQQVSDALQETGPDR